MASMTPETRSMQSRSTAAGRVSSRPAISSLPKPVRPQWVLVLPICRPGRVSTIRTLWGSIGWATPAALGTAVAAPDRRTVLVTGEGSHQMTVQELGQFARLGLKPIVFVLNNDGYLIERLLARDGEAAYNDVAPWRYIELPHALGCDDWLCLRVSTCGELDEAMLQARAATTGVYIEVVTGRYVSSDLALKLQTAMQAIYKAS
ncbi:thiamine pyrophosphate-dependent enzyme [Devosia riboflavina]